MRQTKYQLIKVRVEIAGQIVKFSAETDKLYQKVKAIYVSLPKDESHFGSTLELWIADQEIFPSGFETKLLASNQSCPTNQRFFLFDVNEPIEANGSHVEGRFTDGGFKDGITFPYEMNIYLILVNEN